MVPRFWRKPIVNIIITPLRWIMDMIYSVVGNYGLTIVLFTLVIKLIILPLDIKQRKSMRAMQDLQPKIDAINKKYEKDPEKKSQKTMELYKKEKVNPMGGCLPLLIQMPILFAMFAVMRHIGGEQVVAMYETAAAGGTFVPESFRWIKNIWQPDNIMAAVIPSLSDLTGTLSVVKNNAILTEETVEMVRNNYEIVMKPVLEMYNIGYANGWAILPIVAGASQYFTTWLMNGNRKGKPETQQSQQNKMMNYMFPLMSVFFCWQYNAAFSIYWVTSNLYTIVTYAAFNFYFDKKAKKQDA